MSDGCWLAGAELGEQIDLSMEVIRQINVPKDVTVVQKLLGPRSEESHFQDISHLISVNAFIFV